MPKRNTHTNKLTNTLISKSKRVNLIKISWELLKANKILFVPNIVLFLINLVLFGGFFYLSGIGNTIVNNSYNQFQSITISFKSLLLLGTYFILTFFVDNYLLTVKYGMIKDVLLKGKTSFQKGKSFANTHYWTTIGIHILSSLIVLVPLTLLALVFFILRPFNLLLSISLFVPIALIYVLYVSIRLIFVYPIMAFEKEGAYKSIKDGFHFVKTHLHHTIFTWLIVLGLYVFASIFKENLLKVTDFLYQQLVVLAILFIILIILIEIAVSVWEHIFIFKSYLIAKKSK
ncbi:hypothetical protein COY27_06380 [Candidatus Woesearchaeota archaeon CG_4_10_14_0_2_um_filter_33_13]|nr:MAG: hypothetical protein COY27_06380 [Candidatus Woesearchaeota archaeon CG_4_10_14_0_2_um_filter_33_13]